MLVLNDPTDAKRIVDTDVRRLVEQRYAEICAGEPYDYDRHGYMVVVEPGDTVGELEAETVVPVMSNLFDEGVRFGAPDFQCQFEALEDHGYCYEGVLIMTDDGFGLGIFIPKVEGVPADLLEMCSQYSEPARKLSGAPEVIPR